MENKKINDDKKNVDMGEDEEEIEEIIEANPPKGNNFVNFELDPEQDEEEAFELTSYGNSLLDMWMDPRQRLISSRWRK